jgi:hypothetical protein
MGAWYPASGVVGDRAEVGFLGRCAFVVFSVWQPMVVIRIMPAMASSREPESDGDPTPWRRASVSLEIWEKAVDLAVVEYEALVRRIAEIYEQGNLPAWLDARDMTSLARRRLTAVQFGDPDVTSRLLGRRSRAH